LILVLNIVVATSAIREIMNTVSLTCVFPGYQETMETIIVTSLILFLIFNLFADEVLASNFKAVTTSTGEKLCTVGEPSDTVMNVRSDIQCGAICVADEFCETYSYKKDIKECDLYECMAPQNYSAVPGCSSYKLQGKSGFIIRIVA